MNVDANAKRYWPIIVCTMIGIAAYFQASAIGSLISASIGGEAHVPADPTSTPGSTDEVTNIAPILSRNPFDSTAGPVAPAAPDDSAEVDSDTGLSECSKGRVVLIAQNDDPNWAFASIDDGSGQAELRRVGDSFGNFQVMSLSWDRVYLTESGKDCFLAMGKSLPTGGKGNSGEKSAKPSGEIADRIDRISEFAFAMDRDTLEEVLGSRGGLLGKTRAEPVKVGDAVSGLKLGSIARDSTLDHLGMKSGDVLQSMGDTRITSPEKLSAAYDSMRESEVVRLRILRDGAPKLIELRIR